MAFGISRQRNKYEKIKHILLYAYASTIPFIHSFIPALLYATYSLWLAGWLTGWMADWMLYIRRWLKFVL